jgi:hypothetical protein
MFILEKKIPGFFKRNFHLVVKNKKEKVPRNVKDFYAICLPSVAGSFFSSKFLINCTHFSFELEVARLVIAAMVNCLKIGGNVCFFTRRKLLFFKFSFIFAQAYTYKMLKRLDMGNIKGENIQ